MVRIGEHPILTFPARRKVTFFFEGRPLEGYEGEPIAAALHAAGVRVLRESPVLGRPRGFFCAVGNCSSCLMVVDGVPNVRVCVEKLREGMRVERQVGKGDLLGIGAAKTGRPAAGGAIPGPQGCRPDGYAGGAGPAEVGGGGGSA